AVKNVSLATLVSRILGYLRDMVTAAAFGNGMVADAFYVAFRIPNLLRNLLGEGALSSSFIPVFTEYLTNKTRQEAQELLNILTTILLILFSGLTLLGIAFAPFIVRIIAFGFTLNPEKLSLTITLTRIMFPFMFAIGLAALALGVLNSLHKFTMPALAPAMLSIAEIFFVLAICPLLSIPIKGLAIGVLVGGMAQLLVQIPAILRSGFSYHFKLWLNHPGIKKIGLLMLPATIGLSVNQVNVFVDTICASVLAEGSVTALYYANRLMQLPLALFGIAIATVAFPSMSRSAAQADIPGLKKTLLVSLRMIFFTIIPCSVGLMILGKPIIRLLFQRHHFTAAGTEATNLALFFFSIGIFAYAGVKVLVYAFYSMKDTKTPVKVGVIAMLLNAFLNVILMQYLSVGGLALATATSSIFNMALLTWILRRRYGRLGGKEVFALFLKVILAAGIMGFCSWYMINYLLVDLGLLLKVALTIVVSASIFFFMAYLLKIEEVKHLKDLIFVKEASEL
ncbi:MAG: murein biosynthesis integral membrane protein MurJ, partial [bacterium]